MSLVHNHMETHAPKNKAIGSKDMSKQEYHFAGSPLYRPMTILASSVEEAEKEWKLKRELVEPKTGNINNN